MNREERAEKMTKLQKQIAAMHPLAMELVSEEFTVADRRKFLEGVPIWMIFELSDALNRLCADDRRKLKAKRVNG
jgi:hypothetical protein